MKVYKNNCGQYDTLNFGSKRIFTYDHQTFLEHHSWPFFGAWSKDRLNRPLPSVYSNNASSDFVCFYPFLKWSDWDKM